MRWSFTWCCPYSLGSMERCLRRPRDALYPVQLWLVIAAWVPFPGGSVIFAIIAKDRNHWNRPLAAIAGCLRLLRLPSGCMAGCMASCLWLQRWPGALEVCSQILRMRPEALAVCSQILRMCPGTRAVCSQILRMCSRVLAVCSQILRMYPGTLGSCLFYGNRGTLARADS